ncbi:hypothetical protein ACFQE5_02020 [Pseudonocardia hispaniensis]|uniref:Uncharacterized protein n=1 Tax=Pseudonocardia hispaniensis TaxID=904933 RepID=A0ABW1IWZ0_9PSEU
MMGYRLVLTCYEEAFEYNWPHVDLFVQDAHGNEINWVHWPAAGGGPEAADAATSQHEPMIRRVTEWRRVEGVGDRIYWVADAEWEDAPEA